MNDFICTYWPWHLIGSVLSPLKESASRIAADVDGLEQLPGRGRSGLQAQPGAAGAAWSTQQCSVTAGVHPATDVSAVTNCSLLVMLLTSRQWQCFHTSCDTSCFRDVVRSSCHRQLESDRGISLCCPVCPTQGLLSFLSAPLIGALSDVWGRKSFLLLTVFFTCAPIPLMKISPW